MSNPRSSIEHVLHGHTRAICDINFSAHHPDILATCSVDSFVHCWDIRSPSRPALSFCDWVAGATQVKWNRQDSHLLASSHDKKLRIWDDRKGAYPLRTIEAHSTKIYGVDWNRNHADSLITCSLDKTIKFWNIKTSKDEPEQVIRTAFPVWRARYTPFGSGLLAMPQRGNNDLHLYQRRSPIEQDEWGDSIPVHRFHGHEDQVKEFLWRSRGAIAESRDHRQFQLVSWGKDKVLRLHRLEKQVLKGVDYEEGQEFHVKINFTRKNAVYKSFRNPAENVTLDDQGKWPYTGPRYPTGMCAPRSNQPCGAPLIGHGIFTVEAADPTITKQDKTLQDIDPITWIKGVKIDNRTSPPSVLEIPLNDGLEYTQSSVETSSDEDDEEQKSANDNSHTTANAQYNVPLPKACGALCRMTVG